MRGLGIVDEQRLARHQHLMDERVGHDSHIVAGGPEGTVPGQEGVDVAGCLHAVHSEMEKRLAKWVQKEI